MTVDEGDAIGIDMIEPPARRHVPAEPCRFSASSMSGERGICPPSSLIKLPMIFFKGDEGGCPRDLIQLSQSLGSQQDKQGIYSPARVILDINFVL